MVSLESIENVLAKNLLDLKGGIPTEKYNQWSNYYIKIRDSAFLSNSEKKRHYSVLTNDIEAYNEANYLNSPLTILKQTFIETGADLKQGFSSALDFTKFGLVPLLILGGLIWGFYAFKK